MLVYQNVRCVCVCYFCELFMTYTHVQTCTHNIWKLVIISIWKPTRTWKWIILDINHNTETLNRCVYIYIHIIKYTTYIYIQYTYIYIYTVYIYIYISYPINRVHNLLIVDLSLSITLWLDVPGMVRSKVLQKWINDTDTDNIAKSWIIITTTI